MEEENNNQTTDRCLLTGLAVTGLAGYAVGRRYNRPHNQYGGYGRPHHGYSHPEPCPPIAYPVPGYTRTLYPHHDSGYGYGPHGSGGSAYESHHLSHGHNGHGQYGQFSYGRFEHKKY